MLCYNSKCIIHLNMHTRIKLTFYDIYIFTIFCSTTKQNAYTFLVTCMWILRQAMRLSSVISAIGWMIIYFSKVIQCAEYSSFFFLQIYRILAFSIVILNFVQLLTRVTYLWTSVDFSRVMVAVPFRMWYDIFQLL